MSITTLYYLQLKKEAAHDDAIWCCAWSRIDNGNGNSEEGKDNDTNSKEPEDYIITGGLDDLVKIWQLVDGKLELIHSLEGHSLGVISVAVTRDGKTLASSSQDSTLILWDIRTGHKLKTMESTPTDVWTLDFSPDGKHLISGSSNGKILIFSVESGKAEQTLDTRGKFILSVAYSPDGKYIAGGALDGIINIFDVAQGKLMHTLEGHAMSIRSLCFSPDSGLLLTASDDGHMKLYDVLVPLEKFKLSYFLYYVLINHVIETVFMMLAYYIFLFFMLLLQLITPFRCLTNCNQVVVPPTPAIVTIKMEKVN